MNPKLLVGITIQENSRRLIDEGSRLSKSLGGSFHMLHIRQGNTIFDGPESSALLEDLFAYGGYLGGEVHFICGDCISEVLIHFIKENHITHLLIGETPTEVLATSPSISDLISKDLPDVELIVLPRETP